MHVRFRHTIIFIAGVVAWFALPLAMSQAKAQVNPANGMGQTAPADQEIIQQKGITPGQIKGLHERFSLSNGEISRLPGPTLRNMLWQVAHTNVDLHAAAIQFRLLKLRDEHGQIPTNAWLTAVQQREHIVSHSKPGAVNSLFPAVPIPGGFGSPIKPGIAGIQSSGWTWLGPGNIGGRVRAILVHPATNSIMWAGGVDGGVWKTTNSGASWFPLDDFMANLAVSCMVMDPANPNVIYTGTGEGTYNVDAVQGAGIFKTDDGGATWTQLASTANSSFFYVNRLAICPTNHLILLAATRNGIYRTIDGGTSWSQMNSTETLDLQFDPTNGQCIASGWNGNAFYSADAGVTWLAAMGLPSPSGFVVGRVELAYAPSNPLIVYASEDNNSGEIYKSTDGGQTYSLVNTGNNYLGGQGWYDNCIWVDPTNPNLLVVGGLDIWRSADGGNTLTDIGGYSGSIHPDNHAIVNIPSYNGTSVRTVFIGNDGGIFKATDIASASSSSGWTDLNNNLGITQFYGAAGNATSGTIVAGAQDNGSDRYTTAGDTNGWSMMFGGDGGFCASDPTNPNYFYGEYVYLQIYRSTDGGASANYIDSGVGDAGGAEDFDPGETNDSSANFIAPFILDPNNPNTILAGGMSLWVSTDVKNSTPAWTAIKASIGTPISAIAVAPGNSDIIWVGYNDGSVYFTTNGTSGSPAWFQANLGTPNLPARYCSRIAIDPHNSSTVYVTFGGFSSGNVWRTTNYGANWTDISAGLPDAPINSLVIKPSDSSSLYVGTEVGVFASADGGATWSTSNDGPANVAVDELFWMGDTLVAATHGRGCFSIVIPSDTLFVTPGTGFNSSGIGGGPFTPTTENLTLTNVGVSTLPWSLVNTSLWLNVSPGNGTLAVGASSTVTASLNATAYTLAAGSYSASVLFTNHTTQATQTRTFALTVQSPERVLNGGFETGDFTDWTLNNDDGFDYVDDGSATGDSPHSGSYFAAFGSYTGDGLCTITQNLSTAPGTTYLVSFWWASTSFFGSGTVPSELMMSWNGTTEFDEVNSGVTGWINQRYFLTATGTSTPLVFGGADDNSYMTLDDVSVVPVAGALLQTTARTGNSFDISWNSTSNLTYQLQYQTNLLSPNWINLGSPITGSGPSITVTNTIGPDRQRFYRIMISP
jgi:photosystem II stability/assembly factor-like uncharacterized protein